MLFMPESGPPQKPNEVGFVGKGGASKRAQFSPQAETKKSELCDDAGMSAFLEKRAEKNFKNR